MKVASIDDPIPRGKYIGTQTSGPPLSEAEHFRRCPLCGGLVDLRDLAWVRDHQEPLPHPSQDGIQ
jgi:hypothetical protein